MADIQDYIAIDSGAAAGAVTRRIRGAVRLNASSPGIGHLHRELADESLRVWPVGSYLIVYRFGTRPVQVVRILHGARDLGAIFG